VWIDAPWALRGIQGAFFSSACFSLRGFVLARTKPRKLKHAPLALPTYFFPFVTSFCTRQLFISAM
jgi:hypothetical protein